MERDEEAIEISEWYTFSTAIDRRDYGTFAYTVIFLDKTLEKELPFEKNGRLRIEGDIQGLSFEGAWQPLADGRKYLILNKKFLKSINARLGDVVECTFTIADQNAVNEPDELRDYLKAKGKYDQWLELTPGRRRGLSHMYFKAKSPQTKKKRADEIITLLIK